MPDIICITNRKLCAEDFLLRIKKIAVAQPAAIILREKDLSVGEYTKIATCVVKICEKYGVRCILHSFPQAAIKLGVRSLHLPLNALENLSGEDKMNFTVLGASCHSSEDAVFAQKAGCTYITAGHIFETDCKKGVPARGLNFLRKVCDCVSIPVYAVGGISKDNYKSAIEAGAKGVCVMSGAMTCPDPQKYFDGFK